MEYGGGLSDKPEIVGLTKLDATTEDHVEDLAAALRHAGAGPVLSLSSVNGVGVTAVLRRLIGIIEEAVAMESRPEEESWSP